MAREPVSQRPRGRPTDMTLRKRREEQILDAAARLFAQRGYDQANTQELADRLGVGKGTIYRYFPSKRELFLAAVDRGMRRLRAYVDAAMEGIEDAFERVAAATRAYLEFFDTHAEFAELLIQERAQFKDRKTPTYFLYREANIGRWRALLESLIAQGRVRPLNVERITEVISDMLYGTMFANYFSGRRRSPAQQAEDVLEVALLGILSDSERKAKMSSSQQGAGA